MSTPGYGLVTGRISSLALDPSDATGNRLYVGTTGGGVWVAQNAAAGNADSISFSPLTDALSALSTAAERSISIGALTVQPGGTGVVLAGTGDPNDALDSYYGAGILRSADGGNTWTLIAQSSDLATGTGTRNFSFIGEGLAGFAWSTVSPQLVVAAVAQAFEGQLVGAEITQTSYKGLYYSADAGANWHLARITDGASDVQGPYDGFSLGNGSAATSVVWNPMRGVFVAAVRFHGYYQSPDGVTWTRMASQPGAQLTSALCPTNPTMAGSPACPIFRGALAVNPLTGDTFAWTVDLDNQDQGLWQDVCAATGGRCTGALSFSKQWSTAALDADTWQGAVTVPSGDYNLTLAAVPSSQDTLILAGANDLWKCSLAMGCTWRNTTNSFSCRSAQVAPFQHAIEWNAGNPLEIFVGNDSGLWRSLDAVGESGPACSADDATHWQNLNGGLGSLAEVESMAGLGATPYTLLAGFGVNGAAGVKSDTGVTRNWPQVLGGEGGPVAIDPANPDHWYINNGAGVSIHRCAQAGPCAPADFGTSPVVTNADVGNDGLVMTAPAPFLVDPVDPSQLLIGTCRLWRGPANGLGWTAANAVASMLDGDRTNASCNGNALIRSLAAAALPGGGEVVYAGVYGALDGGATVASHVMRATMDASGTWSAWVDLALNPVLNDPYAMNFFGFDVSSVTVDPNDATANSVYVTIAGTSNARRPVPVLYRSTDGGGTWNVIDADLPFAAANAVAVDPADANTVYVATDAGVFATRTVGACTTWGRVCWAAYGSGLPAAPVVALSASPAGASPGVLVAGTYGRGLWQIPLISTGTPPTTADANPSSLTFNARTVGTLSPAQAVTVTNRGTATLFPTSISISGDFSESDDCVNAAADLAILPGASCSIQVSFLPEQEGNRAGQLTIAGNVPNGLITVDLSGVGNSAGNVTMRPAHIDFGSVQVGNTSDPQQVTVANSGGSPAVIASISVSSPFVLASNACGTASLAANTDCVLMVEFQPVASGPAQGTVTLVDDSGTHYVQLAGTGTSPPSDTLSAVALDFQPTIIGQNSATRTVTLTNSGMNPLTSISVSTTGPFLQSNNCGTQLAAQSRCSISVQFQPAAQGAQTGTLAVADILTTQKVALSGMGLLPPAFSVNPPSLSFAAQQVGVPSAPMTLTVSNSGGAAMADVGFQISGQAASSFSRGATTCGTSLNAGASCTVGVVFNPVAAGAAAAFLTISSSTPGLSSPAQVPLSGSGQSPSALNVNPTQLTFEATAVGQTSAPQSVTITNAGGMPAAGLTLSPSGPFRVAQTTCGVTLGAGASCTAGVVFAPMQRGLLSGTLSISSSSIVTPTTVALSGTGGLTGGVQMQPAQVSFAATGVGATSIAIPVTISNASTTVVLDNLALTASAGFKIKDTTCGSTLAVSANCAVNVAFAPISAGTQTGALTIASTALGANATVPLSGTGFDFTAVVAGTGSQTVASGQTANYSVTLTPVGGVPQAFTFQCSALPAYAACLFNPSTNNVAAGATGTEAIQITTTQTSGLATPAPGMRGAWNAVVLACGLVLLPLAGRKRRNLLRFVSLFLLAVAALSGCAGSGGGGGGAPPPPTSHNVAAGTHSLSLVVSSGTVQHTVTLTLVVD